MAKLSEQEKFDLDVLQQHVIDSLRSWDRSDKYADYVCRFCNERPTSNEGDVFHRPKCPGSRYIVLLEKLGKEEDHGKCMRCHVADALENGLCLNCTIEDG